MILDDKLEGKYTSLRSVALSDAEFIVDIRNDSTKNSYVHAVSTDVGKQREWIKNQIARSGDYYFVIEDENNKLVGLASIYNVGEPENAAEFGRWISWGSSIQNVESVILAFDFAFEKLGVEYIYVRAMKENTKVKRFWKQFGAECVGDVYEMDMWLSKSIITREAYYDKLRAKTLKLLRY